VFEQITNSRVARLAMAVSERYGGDSGGYLSASIAFYGFLSLFPLILLALSVIGFVLAGNPGLQDEVTARVADAVPGLEKVIGRSLKTLEDTRAGAGALAVVALFWTATGAVGASRNALQRVFRQPPIEGFVRQKLWLVVTTTWLGAVALVTTALAAAIGGIRARGAFGVFLVIVISLATAALDFGLFLVAYRVLLRRRYAFSQLWPGALFAAIGWAILKLAGAWYVTRTVSNSSAVYGAFGAAVAALLLLFLAARLFVYGAELNAVMIEQGGGGRVEGEREDGGRPAAEPVRAGNPGPDRSTGELMRAIGTDVVDLARKEIELAKQEVKEGIAARIKGIVALVVGAVLGLFGLGFLAGAAAWGLDEALQPWASRLIVGGVFVLGALLAALAGAQLLRSAPLGPQKTKETIKEDVEWARAQLKR
jgi:membrane protein